MALEFPRILIVRELHLKVARRTGNPDSVFTDYEKMKKVFSTEDLIELLRLNDTTFLSSSFAYNFLNTVLFEGSSYFFNSNPSNKSDEKLGAEYDTLINISRNRNKGSSPFSFTETVTGDNKPELPYKFISLDENKVLLVLSSGTFAMNDIKSFITDYLKLCYSRISIPEVNATRAFALYFRLL